MRGRTLIAFFTASIVVAATPGTDRSTPAGISEPVEVTFSLLGPTCTARLTMLGFLRDPETLAEIQHKNRYGLGRQPKDADYIAVQLSVEMISVSKGSCTVANVHFQGVSDSGEVLPAAFGMRAPESPLQAELYPGSKAMGWIVVQVHKSDKAPLLTFGRRYDGTGGAWFRLYD